MAEAVLLRDWRDDDLESFVQMNADPEVMAFFERPLSREESAAMLGRIRQALRDRGWGLWAVDVDGRLAGFTGLAQPTFSSPFTPCVEIGWRLRREFWGRGLAFQAARQAEAYAFKTLGLPELVSFTAVINQRSRRLMERLGFVRNPKDDFLHPRLPAGHPIQPHVLYRKQAPKPGA